MRDAIEGLHDLHLDEWPIAAQLENWARWLQPRQRFEVSPMFRMFRSTARARTDYGAATPMPAVEAGAAQAVERAVAALHAQSPTHAGVLRWYYVGQTRGLGGFARRVGVRITELSGLLRDARKRLAGMLPKAAPMPLAA